MIDILLDNDNDVLTQNGDFALGDSTWQDVGIIIQMNQGELKSDPILGASLIRKKKANASDEEIEQIVKLHLARDGKKYNELKSQIRINTQE